MTRTKDVIWWKIALKDTVLRRTQLDNEAQEAQEALIENLNSMGL